jgi:hypothetical protein
VQECQVCGRRFDPLGFQVIVPELARGFDRLQCAQSARAAAPAASRVAVAPLAAAVEPIGLVAAAAPSAWRPNAVPAATFGVLAVGTAAAVFLWLRALGTDTAAFPFTSSDAPPAAAHETVQAQPLGEPETVPAREEVRPTPRGVPTRIVVVNPGAPDQTSAGATRAPTDRTGGAHRPVSRDVGDEPGQPGKARTKDESHHGKAVGHLKHGDTQGTHVPGHGGTHGSNHASAANAGHGKGHGKSKNR